MTYESFRHFADSWGLVYMVAIFLVVSADAAPAGRQEAGRRCRADPLPTKTAETRTDSKWHSKEIDEISGVETTGHEWDGIKELNTPLPRWWLWTFYACIAFAVVYAVLYPGLAADRRRRPPGVLG